MREVCQGLPLKAAAGRWREDTGQGQAGGPDARPWLAPDGSRGRDGPPALS